MDQNIATGRRRPPGSAAVPVGRLLGFLVADRMERKWQIVCSGTGIGTFMLLFALQTNQAVTIALGILVTLSNNWLSFSFHNYQAELFPTRVRARAVGLRRCLGQGERRLCGTADRLLLQLGRDARGGPFIGIAMTLMILIIGIFGPKTLNEPLEEISH